MTQGHTLMKGLTGGRVRVPPGETAIGAVARRIMRDTYCEVVAVHEEQPEESDGYGGKRQYRLTLRGRDGLRGAGDHTVEGPYGCDSENPKISLC